MNKYMFKYILKDYGVKDSPEYRVSSALIRGKNKTDATMALLGIGRFLRYYVEIVSIENAK